jgi:hypothetical protein
VFLPGIHASHAIFEIVGRVGQVSAEQQELRARYELALGAYRRGDWPTARNHFADCLSISPEDGPARTMLQRIETLAVTPATAGSWSSVWRLGKDDRSSFVPLSASRRRRSGHGQRCRRDLTSRLSQPLLSNHSMANAPVTSAASPRC